MFGYQNFVAVTAAPIFHILSVIAGHVLYMYVDAYMCNGMVGHCYISVYFERYYQMMCCWNPNPFKRPTFSQLKTDLEALLNSYSQEKYELLSYVRPYSLDLIYYIFHNY